MNKGGRPVNPKSLRQRLMAAGIPRGRFYQIRNDLIELGVEFTTADVMDICRARRRS